MEANAILYTEHKIRNTEYNHKFVRRADNHRIGNTDFVRIAHLYVKMYVLISHSLDACGLHALTVSISISI